MLWWTREQQEAVDGAVTRSQEGPVLLTVEGEAGAGKTSLLREVVRRAGTHRLLLAEGREGSTLPYAALRQWGAQPPPGTDQWRDPILAAQALRARLDDAGRTRPVALVLDDAQWTDADSMEALMLLLGRVDGDPLLVAVGHRSEPGRRTSWQRWAQGWPGVIGLELLGLPREAVHALMTARFPALPSEVADALHRHTRGNPLYVTALLREHDAATLARTRGLPAPAEYGDLVRQRLAQLPRAARCLVEALSVVGDGWWSVPFLTEVTGLDDVTAAAQDGIEAGMLEAAKGAGVVSLRMTHALLTAAVHQQQSLPQRRSWHRRVAAATPDRSARLQHLAAAADQWDDALARELHGFAGDLHDRGTFASAAQHFELAAQLWSSADRRTRSELEAMLNLVYIRDAPTAEERARRYVQHGFTAEQVELVEGMAAVVEGRWPDAVRLLSPLTAEPVDADLLDDDGTLDRYRAEVLLAFARGGSGAEQLVAAGLAAAEALPRKDPVLLPYVKLGFLRAGLYTHGLQGSLDQLADLPHDPAELSAEESYALAWRGLMLTQLGFLPEALADLKEAERRVWSGLTDLVNGGFHCVLGTTLWLAGDWDRARMAFGLAQELPGRFVLPPCLAFPPMYASGVGRLDEADRQLAEARDALQVAATPDSVDWLVCNEVIRAHAGGEPAAQRRVWPGVRAQWPEHEFGGLLAGPPVLLHFVLAAIWADDVVGARRLLAQLDGVDRRPPWLTGVSRWLHALLTEQQGGRGLALRGLREAAAADTSALPLYRAHILADLARLARQAGDRAGATAATDEAVAAYARLGAAGYVERLGRPEDRAGPGRLLSDTLGLTAREHDVAVLTLQGLSYEQIAATLFVTRNTVSYHLRNVYAKAGVRSRFELREVLGALSA